MEILMQVDDIMAVALDLTDNGNYILLKIILGKMEQGFLWKPGATGTGALSTGISCRFYSAGCLFLAGVSYWGAFGTFS